jgi:murein DD-endopeptidase MepM/ murein hydrolase activator NlpD
MLTIQTLRRSRGLTLVDLALLSGIPARTLGAIECGIHTLDHTTRATLSAIFGIAPEQLHSAPPPALQASLRARMIARARSAAPAVALGLASAALIAPLLPARPAADPLPTLPAAALQVEPVAAPMLRLRLPQAPAPAAPVDLAALPAQLEAPAAVVAPQIALPIAQRLAAPIAPQPIPQGCPIPAAGGAIVLTQGYGVGSHAPAAIWGGIDLAIDGDGDGIAEPETTQGLPVYATHDGIAELWPLSWPGGNYLRIVNADSGWNSAYAHLESFEVADGQRVRAGDLIGRVGSTGQATGPHLHYEVWRRGENIDPTPLTLACVMMAR